MTQQPNPPQQKQIGRYLVQVIREKCISAGSCVAIAPQVFDLDEEGIARIISQDGNDDDTKLLAAQSCPTAAIIVTDTQTGQQVWPPIFDEPTPQTTSQPAAATTTPPITSATTTPKETSV